MSQEFKFEEAIKRLNEIVTQLDNESLELDKSIELFEEGLKLSNQLQEKLKSYETRIDTIVKEYSKEDENESDYR